MHLFDTVRGEPDLARWSDELPTQGPPVPVPHPDELPEVLLDLSVPHDAINEIVAVHAAAGDDIGFVRLRDRVAWAILEGLGQVEAEPTVLPELPATLGALGRLFYLYAGLGVLPHIQAFHRAHGVPPDVSRRTLADIGRQVAAYQRRHGVVGQQNPRWTVSHLRGELYQVGRQQYQIARLGNRTGQAVAAAGGPGTPGSPSLALHIPGFCGPLSPSAVARSIEAAHGFFATCFPDEKPTVATCHSWLLDPQLGPRLPSRSRIVAFQYLFRPGYPVFDPGDEDALRFVFDQPDTPLESLPQDTSLRRVIVEHLRGGGHWYTANGWFPW